MPKKAQRVKKKQRLVVGVLSQCEPPLPSRPAWSPFATVRRALAWLSKLAQGAVDVAIFAAVLAAPLALVALAAWTCLPRGAKARVRDGFAPPPKGASMS